MWIKILLLFFAFSFLFRTDFSFDQDLGRHLKLGEIIWQTKNVPKTNLFSYTNPDFPFINTHWLFEVFAFITSQTLGLQALLFIKLIIFLVAVWLILRLIPKGNTALLLPVGFIFFHLLRERLELRPEIFSFLFTAGTYFILEKYLRGPTKLIFLLPLIQLLWINTHIYFFVGLGLQAIFLAHLGYQYLRFHLEGGKLKLLTIIFVLSVTASLVNPNGLSGLLYPLNVNGNYGYTIAENQTMFLLESINFYNPNFLFVKLCLGLIILLLIASFLRKRFEFKNILIIAFGTALALLNIRSFPYLVFLSMPAVLLNMVAIKPNRFTYLLSSFFALLLILESIYYLNGNYYLIHDSNNRPSLKLMESSKQAMDFVINNDLPGPIYNNFDIGSYIIYRGFPKIKVFADGRPEAYPKEFFSQIYIPTQSDYSKFKELENQVKFQTIIFSHTDQTPWGKAFLASVVKDDTWKIAYLDDFMIVLVKEGVVSEKNLKIIDLSKLNGSDFKFDNPRSYLNLSLFLLNTGNQNSALSFTSSALKLFPQSPFANAVFENLTGQPSYSSSSNIFW
ncbi:hypothetical protein M1437_00670 [Patescibacteria group bacterium]|nr:hypothetical protein [Patescibacteria group bacterium]